MNEQEIKELIRFVGDYTRTWDLADYEYTEADLERIYQAWLRNSLRKLSELESEDPYPNS